MNKPRALDVARREERVGLHLVPEINWVGWSLGIVAVIVIVLLYLPTTVMGLQSFNDERVSVFPIAHFSLRWYKALIANRQMISAFLNSVGVATATMLIATPIGTAAAFGLVRHPVRGRDLIVTFLLMPLIMPTLILGVALLLLYSFLRIQGSLALIVLGHVVYTVPVVVLFVMARLTRIPRQIEEAAANLGAPPIVVLRKITLPLVMPAVIAGAIFAFALSLDELPIAFFSTGNQNTFPVVIWASFRYRFNPELYALGTALGIVTLVATVISLVLLAKPERRAPQEEVTIEITTNAPKSGPHKKEKI